METKNGKVLIVDDNPSVLNSLKLYLKYKFEEVKTITNPNQVPELVKTGNFDVILLDMNFAAGVSTGNEGIFWMRNILEIDPLAVIVLITAYGDIELAVKAIKEGATDFVLKPWDNKKLLSTLQAAIKLRYSKLEVKDLKQKQLHLSEDIDRYYEKIIGKSQEMEDLFSTIKKVAVTETNVLIVGENGTGKELVAKEIHRQSERSNEIFSAVDLGTLSETLFESELFGHKKGSFTDANEDRVGRFETASGGTLFLDEIGNLPISLQSKLLTVLQNRYIIPVGTNQKTDIDIRLICATNKNVEKLIRENLFREDLYFRINTITVEVPPLRDRGDDIPLLTDYFLKQFSEKYEKPLLKITGDALDKLNNYHWPGNVRELKHTMEKAVILCESNNLKPDDLFITEAHFVRKEKLETLTMEEHEMEIIRKVLKKHKGNISYTAKELEIGRQTLYRKINKYGL